MIYKVIGKKREVEENGEKKIVYDAIAMVAQVGAVKGKEVKWDPGVEVTEKQVSDEQAAELIAAGELEKISDETR